MRNDWPGAEWWAEPGREFAPVFFLLTYGIGTVVWPVALAWQGRLTEFREFSMLVLWGWGALVSLFSAWCAQTVYRARCHLEKH